MRRRSASFADLGRTAADITAASGSSSVMPLTKSTSSPDFDVAALQAERKVSLALSLSPSSLSLTRSPSLPACLPACLPPPAAPLSG